MRYHLLSVTAACFVFLVLFFGKKPNIGDTLVSATEAAPKATLSAYGFFQGRLADLQPIDGVLPYSVNAPLFTDYAEKSRFILLPEGQKPKFEPAASFDFPVGSVIIKNFHYPTKSGRRIVETRLLLREEQAWKALTYLWRSDQSDADLCVAGETVSIEFQNQAGKPQKLDYILPNLNQCKGCHSVNGQIQPIGTTARQMNRWSPVFGKNQLHVLFGETMDTTTVAPMPDYSDAKVSLEQRARAYLDANCAHCHRAEGPASTSGLFLDFMEKNPERIGLLKSPVAAGRGSGGRKYAIQPGAPNKSILLFRMESTDTGIQMPELGRQLVHSEGVALIREWIAGM